MGRETGPAAKRCHVHTVWGAIASDILVEEEKGRKEVGYPAPRGGELGNTESTMLWMM